MIPKALVVSNGLISRAIGRLVPAVGKRRGARSGGPTHVAPPITGVGCPVPRKERAAQVNPLVSVVVALPGVLTTTLTFPGELAAVTAVRVLELIR